MRTGRPTTPIKLSDEERRMLTGWTRRLKSAQALALRSRIVLYCAESRTNSEVAGLLRITKQTVGKWRARFLARRRDGLLDEPRPGAPRRIADEQIEAVVTRTLESMPRDATHWSTRSMAEASGVSHMTVKRIWGAFGLEPHRGGDIQAFHRPAVRGQGAGHRRLVFGPAGSCAGSVCG